MRAHGVAQYFQILFCHRKRNCLREPASGRCLDSDACFPGYDLHLTSSSPWRTSALPFSVAGPTRVTAETWK